MLSGASTDADSSPISRRSGWGIPAGCRCNFPSREVFPVPPLFHGKDWRGHDVAGWWASEKYNGARAYWNGARLLSRFGNDLHAPAWFTAGLPPHPLDGELWLGRGFKDNDAHRAIAHGEWEQLRLVVFDLPGLVAEKAIAALHFLKLPTHAVVPEFTRVRSTFEARMMMARMVADGGEGIMLRRPGSIYRNTRTEDLLKLKPR